MESRGPEDSKNVKTSQAYFFEGFISFFEDFSLTTTCGYYTHSETPARGSALGAGAFELEARPLEHRYLQ